ncbi:hypothetical protein ASD62_04850 [Phycicoccus sp. Root563]|uniref:TetR/AcrR family transcriptional regulator n=1 Tax=unclassified Phycicoccus TaxID=2637926 RepID=UPI0007037930|nr:MULTISPECIES: WHG domain-containing protein [unclassified Phycicoccus]KQU70445.1 hypothetical protein ASC58_01075 [Phycicoccus sp. Root101]KQZ88734.1 hypothetical protein ASD62_04850 [Phycicoccus sp. Root563]
MTTAPTRRERQRQATYDEIVEVSRRLLRAGEDVSIRAVAQEMGLTPPALYRYVDSHAELMQLVARSIFGDVVAAMVAARDEQPDDDPAAQIVASAGAFRRWALGNHEEFQLAFASPTSAGLKNPATGSPQPITSLDDCAAEESGAHLFAGFFSEIFGRLWVRYRFPIPTDDDLDPDVVSVLRGEIAAGQPTQGKLAHGGPGVGPLGAPTPGMMWMFERSWARLYGTVTLEVFGHVHPAFISSGALFRAAMLDIARELHIDHEWDRLQDVVRDS